MSLRGWAGDAVSRVAGAGVAWRLLVVLASTACVVLAALPDPSRPVVVGSVLAVTAAVVAAVAGWRLAGTVALGAVTLAVLLASALDASDLRPVQVVAAGLLVLVVTTALDHVEAAGQDRQDGQGGQGGKREVTVLRAPAPRRLGTPALAIGAASLVAVTAAQHVVPSVGLVLLGTAAAVAALVVATGSHRS